MNTNRYVCTNCDLAINSNNSQVRDIRYRVSKFIRILWFTWPVYCANASFFCDFKCAGDHARRAVEKLPPGTIVKVTIQSIPQP